MLRNLPPLLVGIAGVIWVALFLHLQDTHLPDAPPIPTPQDVVEKMLELAGVDEKATVYDLGCGDGRFVVTAAKKYGCKATGIDIDPARVEESRANAVRNGVQDLVTIRQGDIFKLDLRPATVITLYLKPSLNAQLIPQLDQMEPGARIVSHQFSMPGVTPTKVVQVKSREDGVERPIYLWVTPLEHAVSAEQLAEAPFPYAGPSWIIVAIASVVGIGLLLLVTRLPKAILEACVGAVCAAGLAWWTLGCGRGYMTLYVQQVCSGVLALVGAACVWMLAPLGKARPKQEVQGGEAPMQAVVESQEKKGSDGGL